MIKIIKLSFILALCVIILTACNKEQRAIEKLSDFVEEVAKNAPEYSDEDWTKKDAEYEALLNEISKYNYSSEDCNRIGELKGRYSGIKAKNSVRNLFKEVDKATEEIKGVIKGFTKGIAGSTALPDSSNINHDDTQYGEED